MIQAGQLWTAKGDRWLAIVSGDDTGWWVTENNPRHVFSFPEFSHRTGASVRRWIQFQGARLRL